MMAGPHGGPSDHPGTANLTGRQPGTRFTASQTTPRMAMTHGNRRNTPTLRIGCGSVLHVSAAGTARGALTGTGALIRVTPSGRNCFEERGEHGALAKADRGHGTIMNTRDRASPGETTAEITSKGRTNKLHHLMVCISIYACHACEEDGGWSLAGGLPVLSNQNEITCVCLCVRSFAASSGAGPPDFSDTRAESTARCVHACRQKVAPGPTCGGRKKGGCPLHSD